MWKEVGRKYLGEVGFTFAFKRTGKKTRFYCCEPGISPEQIGHPAALSSTQPAAAGAQPEAEPPMGRGRAGEEGEASRRGSERQEGGQPWEKTWKIRTGAESTGESGEMTAEIRAGAERSEQAGMEEPGDGRRGEATEPSGQNRSKTSARSGGPGLTWVPQPGPAWMQTNHSPS